MHRVAVAVRVHHPHPLRVSASNLVVALGNAALQIDALLLESVGLAAADPARRPIGVDAQENRQIGPDAAGREVADLLDPLGSKPAGDP